MTRQVVTPLCLLSAALQLSVASWPSSLLPCLPATYVATFKNKAVDYLHSCGFQQIDHQVQGTSLLLDRNTKFVTTQRLLSLTADHVL